QISGTLLKLNINALVAGGKTLVATGPVNFQNQSNSTNAFSVNTDQGNPVLQTDTTNKKVGINQAPTAGGAALQVNGTTSTSQVGSAGNGFTLNNQGLYFANQLICNINGCKTANAISLPNIDVNNLAYLNQNQTFSGATTFSQQIQAAQGVDGLGYSVNGVAGNTFTCSSGDLIQNAVVSGGIITGGTCVPGAGASIATLQQSYTASSPATIVLSSANGGIMLQDGVTPLGTDLFSVTDNTGATKYFAVNSGGISTSGNVAASSFSGNGNGLTNVNAAQLNGQSA